MVRLGLGTGKMWSRHRKDAVPRKLCGSVRWSGHRKDGAPRKLCGGLGTGNGVPRELCGSVYRVV